MLSRNLAQAMGSVPRGIFPLKDESGEKAEDYENKLA